MNYLVVAVYNETYGWTDKYRGEWSVRIVRKDFDLPNKGREASTYFHDILNLYDWLEPEDYVAFVQGRPFDHCPDLGGELRKRPERFDWLGRDVYTCDANGAPHAPGMKMNPWLTRLLKQEPREHFDFVPGGQFIVSGEAILSRPKQFYDEMFRACMDDESGFAPYVFERLWGYIWL